MSEALDRELRWLIARYGAFVRVQLRRLRPRAGEAELDDLEQEVRLRLWEALRREKVLQQPASYLQRVVLAVTVDAVRRGKARGSEFEHVELGALDEAAATAPLPIDAAARRQLLEQALKLLGPDDPRAQCVGLYAQGFTTEEIGRLLDWTEAKARNVLYRALESLRQAFDDSEAER
jgi:RNA polymerase sigma-70 factor (ECF subfamily)